MSSVRRVFYDFEFLEDGHTIEPLSIGMCDEEGRELYLINSDFPLGRLVGETWLEANVVPFLPISHGFYQPYSWGPVEHEDYGRLLHKPTLANRVRQFLLPSWSPPLELWGYFPSYDHVLLAQLFGRMADLPPGIPMHTRDVAQLADDVHCLLPPNTQEHHALADARWTRTAYQRCVTERTARK
jgi:hypothetical protein